jgi:hypothetical protein
MHSNFITPPDFVETVLIIDANTEQANECARVVRESTQAYNIYLYHEGMADPNWLATAAGKAETILQMQGSRVPLAADKILVGADQEIKKPADYFAK